MDSGTPTCPRCHGDFVEEIEDMDDPRDFIDDEGADEDEEFSFYLGGGPRPAGQNGNADPDRMGNAELGNLMQMWLAQILGNNSGGNGAETEEESAGAGVRTERSQAREVNPESDGRQRGAGDGEGGAGEDGSADEGTSTPTPHRTSRPRRPRPVQMGSDGIPTINFADIFQQVLQQSSRDSPSDAPRNPLMALLNMVGNPGDYVFGANGLDDVITRLMDQHARANQPPSASDEVIDALEKGKAVLSELREHTECPVCQDDYVEGEEVMKMPCRHVFHPMCLREWLKVNGMFWCSLLESFFGD
ncbi:hypothetical protein HDV00_008698 [Rhizophlyctis rosea]|nr:hypothetical protein HDV00_008698 [Rhizophlyctis rosea]